jgi:hypothetical protein
MKSKVLLFLCALSFLGTTLLAQQSESLKWWNPAESNIPVLEGRGWADGFTNFYDRLPAKAKPLVRKEVWDLSRNAAGLKILFKTDAKRISIRYVVTKKAFYMNHFPTTGVSGVDLYSLNKDGSWAWASASYKFGDTVSYDYSNLDLNTSDYKDGRSYHLYLPLYNDVSWLEIGVPESATFTSLPPRMEKPIVVYGTSIAQGGCASRPGMAWTSILERNLSNPVINLGFSGNGRLEKELIDLIAEIDAKLFVLDCLPNLSAKSDPDSILVEQKILESVAILRKKHPNIPILLTGHSGYTENRLDATVRNSINRVNHASEVAFQKLKTSGVGNLYYLPARDVTMGIDGTVDGSHPSDLGMYKYAKSYEKKIRSILKIKNRM